MKSPNLENMIKINSLSELNEVIDGFIESNSGNIKASFAIFIETKGSSGLEAIVNGIENMSKKKEYINKAYNEDLILKTYDGIKIVGFVTSY